MPTDTMPTDAMPTDAMPTDGQPASVPTVLAVDGNSLGHRGFHSAREDEDAHQGRPFVTGAVVSMLASAWIHGPYDAIVIGFDHEVNRRKLDHPDYKANRPPAHPDLAGHLTDLRAHLRACGFSVLEHEGAEADDVLAATVDACTVRGWNCDLLSSDRDLTALVGPGTRLLRPAARFSDLLIEDVDAVRARYGVEPHQYVDLAALRGDPSDGLPGATGIGPKMAARLVRDYGSVAGIYDAIIDLHPKVEASLRSSREQVERNLVLMAPIPHLEVDVDAALEAGVDHEQVIGALTPLGLEGAARRFAWARTAPPRPPAPPPPNEAPDANETHLVRRRQLDPAPTDGEQVALF